MKLSMKLSMKSFIGEKIQELVFIHNTHERTYS